MPLKLDQIFVLLDIGSKYGFIKNCIRTSTKLVHPDIAHYRMCSVTGFFPFPALRLFDNY